ncbi:MAG: 3-methyladenine DNA glycosylase [Actinomycetota bacterium]
MPDPTTQRSGLTPGETPHSALVPTGTLRSALTPAQWQAEERRHHALVDTWITGHRARRSAGADHPVEDFLFTYYVNSPGRLRRWHPGAGVVLLGDTARTRLAWRYYTDTALAAGPSVTALPGVTVDLRAFVQHRRDRLTTIARLLRNTAAQPAHYGCFGLHEWAMVYQDTGQRQHAKWPLRLTPTDTNAVVEALPLRCTHYDAFRFFTPAAKPRNLLQLNRPDQTTTEQPGCLHAGMDLYKWCYKLTPAMPSRLTIAAFTLARRARELDMRASPYDLTALGYRPIRIETPQGRTEYVSEQRAITSSGQTLRNEILAWCDSVSLSSG